MSNNITYTLEVSFKEECHIINLPMEYPQFTGSEEWAKDSAFMQLFCIASGL